MSEESKKTSAENELLAAAGSAENVNPSEGGLPSEPKEEGVEQGTKVMDSGIIAEGSGTQPIIEAVKAHNKEERSATTTPASPSEENKKAPVVVAQRVRKNPGQIYADNMAEAAKKNKES